MKIPFLHNDPKAALAQTEAKIAELERARADALLTENYVGAVEAIDGQLATQRRAIDVHRERIAAMVRKHQADDRAELEREKAARIADTRKRLADLQSAAKQVDVATAALQSAVRNLDRADATLFGDSWNHLCARSIPALADRAAGPRDELGINETRRVIGPLRKIASGAAHYRLAEEVEERGRRLIELMECEPIPEPDVSDDEPEVAAA